MDGPEVRRLRMCVGENDNSRSALSLLRVMVADTQDMAMIGGGSRYVYRTARDIQNPLSIRNERAAMHQLMTIVQRNLNAYPTSLKEDREKLEGNTLKPFSNARHAAIQVSGEKVVLLHYLQLAETALACLAAKTTAEMEESRWQGKDKLVIDYCSGPILQIWEQDYRARSTAPMGRTWGGQMTLEPTIV
ncbi:unnamed protein product [Discosporangium mesarthrocarpum]